MKQRNKIVEWVTDPTKNFLTSFVVGTLLFTVISDGISALFWENFSPWLQGQLGIDDRTRFQQIFVAILIAIVLVFIYATPLSRWLKRRLFKAFDLDRPPAVQTHANPLADTFPGLIAVMSPKNPKYPDVESPAERAIEHHWNCGNGHLTHCWLICTSKTQDAARELEKKLVDRGMSQTCNLHYGDDYKIDDLENPGNPIGLCIPDDCINDPIYVRDLIDRIYADAQIRYGLDELEIIADFTGGPKSISAGMILACATTARRLQYISQLGQRELMEIKIAYKLVSEKRG